MVHVTLNVLNVFFSEFLVGLFLRSMVGCNLPEKVPARLSWGRIFGDPRRKPRCVAGAFFSAP